jgi:hypothetical protein
MDTLSLPRKEFSLLTAYLPELRQSLVEVMERRTRENHLKMKKAEGQ